MIISDKQYKPDVLHKIWDVELEILDVIDDFCKMHKIKYSIAYGTLLGAVRHKGFIPWDDDIDIMMLREDYNRFRQLWLENPPKGYAFVDDILYDEYHENFAKIRKINTSFIQFDVEYSVKKMPLGIFVDIFVLDRVAPTEFQRKKQYFYSLVNMLYTRMHTSGKGGVIGVVERVLLSLPIGIRNRIKNKTRKYIVKWNGNNTNLLVNFCVLKSASMYFPANSFESIISLEFENRTYCAVELFDDMLKVNYADYMKLPPENLRASHYPLFLDFEHSWEELNKEKCEK